jgi:diguanylate cyclase (GGDEF)-like protein
MARSKSGYALARAVWIPTAITLMVVAVVVGAILEFSTRRSDQLALGRQYDRLNVAIAESMLTVASNQEASTYWDDAVIRTRQRPLDLVWLDNNLGVWFHTYYGFDQAYVLDERDTPVYAMQDGRRSRPDAFAVAQRPALELAHKLRRELRVSYRPRLPGEGRTAGAAELTVVAGRPAVVSVKPILSETGDIVQVRGSEYLHVAVRFLDRSFLERMARSYGIEEPRFTPRRPAGPAIALTGHGGQNIGYITWKPFEPGQQIADEMIPVLLAALLAIGGLVSLLLWRVHRSRQDLEASRAQAQRQALHDSLTGLPNRALFEDQLTRALRRRSGTISILLLDLDRFKQVNDTLGHQGGDALLVQFGERLTALMRASDMVARFGGDEFAILVEDSKLPDTLGLAERIIDDVRPPFELSGGDAYVGVSIGIAVSEGPGGNPIELMRKADIALYRAKESGRNNYRLFSPEMDECIRLRCETDGDLRAAVASGQGLCLYYQPMVDGSGKLVGVEALLRWNHPRRGLITPDQFISIAEETGLIVPIGEWVLREACTASRLWPQLFVAVNLSAAQFQDPDLFDTLMWIIDETGADPRAIELEVTERVLLDDDESVRSTLARLRLAGFKIVLDDFGTGFSSLSYLHKFAVDKIKIDQSFVRNLSDRSDSRAIISAVLALGAAMDLKVSAEGVETAEQKTFLEIAGCHEFQGHYFSPALPKEEIAARIARSPAAAA